MEPMEPMDHPLDFALVLNYLSVVQARGRSEEEAGEGEDAPDLCCSHVARSGRHSGGSMRRCPPE